MTALIPVAVALVPVLLFLAGLQLMDSFKLVRIRAGASPQSPPSPSMRGCFPSRAWR